jgi:hypothetical protein
MENNKPYSLKQLIPLRTSRKRFVYYFENYSGIIQNIFVRLIKKRTMTAKHTQKKCQLKFIGEA